MLVLLGLMGVLTACGSMGRDSPSTERRLRYSFGLNPHLDKTTLQKKTEDENEIIASLVTRAGLEQKPPLNSSNWKDVADAGLNFVDEECEAYVDALFWYNRAASTARSELNLVGAATATAMGLLEASAKSIALTAAAFGLAGASIDVASSGVLYKIDPTAVRALIERRQAAYRTGFQNTNFTSRPAAMRAVADYLSLCLPASLESEITATIASTGYKPAETTTGTNAPITLERYTRLREPPPPPPPNTSIIDGLTPTQRMQVQRALCVKPDGVFGAEGSNAASRQAVRLYHAARNTGQRSNMLSGRPVSDRLSNADAAELLRVGDCDGTLFRNAYERFLLSRFNPQTRKLEANPGPIREIRKRLGMPEGANDGVFDRALRDRIDAFIRDRNGDPNLGLTPALEQALPGGARG